MFIPIGAIILLVLLFADKSLLGLVLFAGIGIALIWLVSMLAGGTVVLLGELIPRTTEDWRTIGIVLLVMAGIWGLTKLDARAKRRAEQIRQIEAEGGEALVKLRKKQKITSTIVTSIYLFFLFIGVAGLITVLIAFY